MSFACHLRAEAVKLLTRRSIPVTAVAVLAAGILIAYLETPMVLEAMRSGSSDLAPGVTLENMGFDMVSACQLGMVAIGALAASGEYGEHGLRTSLLSMPRRASLIMAQAIVLMTFCLMVALVSVPLISLAAQVALGESSVVRPGVPMELILDWMGATLFWVASALATFSLVHVFRGVAVPLFLMVCLSLSTYAALSITTLACLLPTTAGIMLFDATSITAAYPAAGMSRVVAAAVVVGWTVAVGTVAFVAFLRRPCR